MAQIRKIINYKMTKDSEVQSGIVSWEALVLILDRDHKLTLPPKWKRAIFLNTLPKALHLKLMEHVDRLLTYEQMWGKAISLTQIGRGADDMDCGGVDEPPYYGGWDHDGYGGYGGYEGGEGETDETDLSALTNSGCHRCGGKRTFLS